MKKLIAPVAVLAVCLVASMAYAVYDAAMGELKAIDLAGGKIVVAVRMGRDAEPKDTTFLVTKDTTIRIAREVKTFADLKEGMRVNVTFMVSEKPDTPPTALLVSAFQPRAGGPGGGN